MIKIQPVGYGWQGGLNFYSRKPKKLTFEAQLSVSNVNDKDFPRSYFSINVLGGARYYFLDPSKVTKVYFNALIGPAFVSKFDYDYSYAGTPLGYSTGIFIKNNRIISGISFENYQSFIFKVGFSF